MQEEHQNDEPDDRDLLAQGAHQRVLDAIGEVQSIVDRHQLDVARELGPRLVEHAFDGSR